MFPSEPPSETPDILDPTPFRDELQDLYAALDADIRRAGPTCELSGRCCRFVEYGHTLFLSAPEFAVLRADAPPPCRPVDEGATCPWQDARGRCTAREARPLGCRVYFCDPAYQRRAEELSEHHIGRLKDLADRHGLPWNYAPLHHHLRRAGLPAVSPAPAPDSPAVPAPRAPGP